MKISLLSAALCLTVFTGAFPSELKVQPVDLHALTSCSESDRWQEHRISAEKSLARLRAESKLPEAQPSSPVIFQWPMLAAAGLDHFDYFVISGYMDHDPNYPDQLLDYECGTRTYDTPSGTNHNGTDYVTWPFPWYKMDFDLVEIVAAAPGMIIERVDGHYDRSCTPGGSSNKVTIRHADGSMAWYLHMKNGSVTAKSVGDSVAAGEYLGIVGSSGNSGIPHLHFDVRDSNWNNFDPYGGPCNPAGTASRWDDQRPYYDSAVLAILTHAIPPVFPSCPQQESPNVQELFEPGDQVVITVYHRDLLKGQSATLSLLRPDQSVAYLETYSIHDPYYLAAMVQREYQLPQYAQGGTWTVAVDYESIRYEQTFEVDATTGVGQGADLGVIPFITPNPFVKETSIRWTGMGRPARAEIFSVTGRLVRILESGSAGSDNLSIRWDGRTDSGERATPGVYFIKLRTGSVDRTGRVILLP